MKTFIKKESEHYEYFVFPNSLAEKEIDNIIETQESVYSEILNFLGTTNDRNIKYYLYPSNKIKGEMTGDDGNGHADRDKFEVYAVYNEKVKCIGAHEDTHLLASSIGLPPQLFREGLAEYLSGTWDGKSHDEWVVLFILDNKVPDIAEIINDEKWYEINDTVSYPVAGSFIKYLILTYGKNVFLDIYKKLNRDYSTERNKTIFQKITNVTIADAQNKWLENLNNIKNIQTRILDLIPKEKQSQKGILLSDSCSELSRLVGAWIKEDDNNIEAYILKGDNVCGTKKSHDILALDNGKSIYLIDPTVWQFFSKEKSILVGSCKKLDETIQNATNKYGGKWKISEKLDNITLKQKEEWLEVVRKNIEDYQFE